MTPNLTRLTDKTAAAPPLAIVVKGYPRLSETFIAQEFAELEKRGFRFEIWSLRAPYDPKFHPIHDEIKARPRYLPEYLWNAPLRVACSLVHCLRLPGFGAALKIWLRDLRRDLTPNRIRRFGQACVLARELPAETRFLYVHFLHTPASVARYAAIMRGLGWGFSAHAKDIWTTPDWEKREKIADAAFGATCTASGAAHLRGLADDSAKIDLAYHGLDLSQFPSPPDRADREESAILLSVGRLVEKKGYDDLLEALAGLPAGLDWRFVHIGGGELSKQMKAKADALGLSDRIEWRGKRDREEVIAAMREADLFVLPAKIAASGDRDGLPNVLMEAASQDLPILSTAISAIPEFVRDGVDGRLVPPGAPDRLAAAITQALSDPDASTKMARSARARLSAEFGVDAGIDLLAARLRAGLGDAAP